jgi:DNA/RNA non-specific endonuclease
MELYKVIVTVIVIGVVACSSAWILEDENRIRRAPVSSSTTSTTPQPLPPQFVNPTHVGTPDGYTNRGEHITITWQWIGNVQVQHRLSGVLTGRRITGRTDFSSSLLIKGRMTEMNAFDSNTANPDQKGHILAACLGGPAVIWNLTPMSPQCNVREWLEIEKHMCNFLNNQPFRELTWRTILTYTNNNPRAHSFTLHVELRENGNLDSTIHITCYNDQTGHCGAAAHQW